MALFESLFAAVAQSMGMASDGRRTTSSDAARKRQASVNSTPLPRGSKAAIKTKATSKPKPKPKGPQRARAPCPPLPRWRAGNSRNVCDTRMILRTGLEWSGQVRAKPCCCISSDCQLAADGSWAREWETRCPEACTRPTMRSRVLCRRVSKARGAQLLCRSLPRPRRAPLAPASPRLCP